MAMVVAGALKDPETVKALVAGVVGLAQSAPVVALTAIGALALSWNLEHTALRKVVKSKFKTVKYPIIGSFPLAFYEVEEPIPGSRKERWEFIRLSTQDTSVIDDKNLTPFLPPLQSTAIRLLDAGSDTAEAAALLAQQTIATQSSKGLIGNIAEFLFGGG